MRRYSVLLIACLLLLVQGYKSMNVRRLNTHFFLESQQLQYRGHREGDGSTHKPRRRSWFGRPTMLTMYSGSKRPTITTREFFTSLALVAGR